LRWGVTPYTKIASGGIKRLVIIAIEKWGMAKHVRTHEIDAGKKMV